MNLKKVSLLLSVALYATGVASAGAATATAVAHAHTAPVKQKAKPHAKAKSKKATKHKKKKLTKQLQAAKKQKDSMTFGGASGLVPKIDPQNGQLSMSFPLGVLQGNGDSPKLSLSYSSSSQSNLDNLGIGWSFNVTSYNSTTDYLYLGNGAAYRVNIYNGEASWENGQKPEGVVFTTAGASAKPLPPIPGSKATRTYDYTLALHDGSIEYLKNFSASSGTVARVIAVKDRVGNLTNYTYNNFGELTSIISNSGNVMTVSGYPSNVTITMPKDFYGHAKTVKLTKNSQQALEHLVVSATGSSDTFTYTLSAHGSGSNMVNTIQYPSGMTAYIYHNNQMKICTVAQCGSNPQETQTEPLYGEIRYENAAGQTIQVEKVNSQVDDHDFTSDESSGEVHNYTGYPKFSPSNTADLLMHGPGSSSPGYTYTVSTTKGDTTTYSTYNHLHQLIAQDVYDTKLANSNFSKGSPGTLARASFRYADAKGKQADPINGLLMSNFSLNDYNKPVLSTAQTFQLQSNQLAGGPVISMASQYNAYGEVLQQDDKKEQVKVVSTYDDAHGGLLEQKVMYPELVFKPVESDLLKDQAGSDAMGYPQYTKNNIGVIIPASESKTGKDVYGIVSTTTGYLKNGTLQSATPVYQTVLNYDNTGRIKTKTMQFSDAANADKSLQLGNVSSSGSVTTYLDSVTQASQVSSMFLPGQCPAALQANPDAVRVNVSENVGTAMVGGKSTDSSRQSAVISDKVTGKPLYQLSGYNPTTKQYSYVTSYVYDGFGRTVSKTTPDQQTVHYAYTVGNSNNSVTETLPNGDQQKKMFDDFGHLHYEELLNSGASQAILMKQNTYDYNQPQQDQSSYGLLESSIDQAGNKTQLFYNDQQQKMAELTQSQSPSGLAANSPMVTLSFYGHSLADRANSRQISYKSYGEAGKAQSVDFYQVTQMDPHMPSVKLATYTLRAGTYS